LQFIYVNVLAFRKKKNQVEVKLKVKLKMILMSLVNLMIVKGLRRRKRKSIKRRRKSINEMISVRKGLKHPVKKLRLKKLKTPFGVIRNLMIKVQ